MVHCAAMPTRLQLDADRRAAAIRRSTRRRLRRMREDAGLSRAAVARAAGVHPSLVTKLEDGAIGPSLETYARICAALGADFAARPYPNTGPAIRDRHQVRMAELLIGSLHRRWRVSPEVAVRRPARGWIDAVLEDDATDCSSRPSSSRTSGGSSRSSAGVARRRTRCRPRRPGRAGLATATPASRSCSIVRWTRANRDAAEAARRQLREAYPADPRDALDALTGHGGVARPGDAVGEDRPRPSRASSPPERRPISSWRGPRRGRRRRGRGWTA